MKKNRTSISRGNSYKEIGEFWDAHDLGDYWGQSRAVRFEVNIKSEKMYYAVDTALSDKLRSIARRSGVSPETLLNLWIQEKVSDSLALK